MNGSIWCEVRSGRGYWIDVFICESKCKSSRGKMKCKSYLKYLEENKPIRKKLKRRKR